MQKNNYINIEGARVHNLKNIDLKIPRNKLVVITGLSGSGKSSLAFDTIYAEGQRRYMETFSAYVRQFLGNMERPEVDKIDGLSPVIAIEQKTTSKSPRSTVGTITELYDYLRLLYARIGVAYSYKSNQKMISYSDSQIQELIIQEYFNKKISLLAPIIQSRKGHYRELLDSLSRQGFSKVRVDQKIIELTPGLKLDRYKTHDIDLVIDRFTVKDNDDFKKRLEESIKTAMHYGDGTVLISDLDQDNTRYFSKNLMCPSSGISYPVPEPNTFSFNSPKGMCPKCKGLGIQHKVNLKKIIPDDELSIAQGGLAPLGSKKNNWTYRQIETIATCYGFNLTDPIKMIPSEAMAVVLKGSKEKFEIPSKNLGITRTYNIDFEGLENYIKNIYSESPTASLKRWADEFMDKFECEKCFGSRLRKEALNFRINNKNISEVTKMDLDDLLIWIKSLHKFLNENEKKIASEVIKEISNRLQFLLNVGLNYLQLSRSSKSLSGGESQRIRLATQIGSQLMNVLYILDEPSIGLHQRDNKRLIGSLNSLRDLGNSILVVEHDKDMMLSADYLIDMGPLAGKKGGLVISQGNPKQILLENTLTANYLNGNLQINIPNIRRKGNGKKINLIGCSGNNLKNINIEFPLGVMIGITGVSGSGKSSLINETLYPVISNYLYNSFKSPLSYQNITGLENIDKIVDVNQSPIGRTPRSNPVTYCGAFSEIRSLFTKTPEAQIRGYKPGRFSFNVIGGRCENCQGGGMKIIEMNFLPDVHVECESCHGRRFNRETLEVRYKGKSISDVLEMSINEACDFFEQIPKIYRKLIALKEVGLGYVNLGQPSTTLSGGEAQRVKLASELSKKDTGNTLFILDEPTTGLHFEDIRVLLGILNILVDKGNTVMIIEHNLDVIKQADYIFDIGPEGGKNGGKLVCKGTPEELILNQDSHTAKFLKKELESKYITT
tara:strand:- start:40044 stop:42890 length:2847 start_codon:yes stop_codon:yes gene_type:complete